MELTFRPISMLPSLLATHNVLDGLLLELLTIEVAFVEEHLVGTGAAFEAVFAC